MARPRRWQRDALDIVDTNGDYNDPNNWRSSVEYGGSPGTAGLGKFSDVVVNELRANSVSPQVDTIELVNTSSAAINVGGWWLSDTSDNLEKFRIPDNIILQPGQYVDFDESKFDSSSPPAGDIPFALSDLGGDLWLTATDSAGDLVRFADHVTYDASAAGVSLGRWPNGSGSFFPMSAPTFADQTEVATSVGSNRSPLIGPAIISEIDYNPGSPNDDREFVEIGNPTAGAVDISGWELQGDVSFVFPAGTSIPAGGAIVVVHFDPAHPNNASIVAGFQSFYGIGSGVPLYGPYNGVLGNDGGGVQLWQPDAALGGTTPYLLVDDTTFDVTVAVANRSRRQWRIVESPRTDVVRRRCRQLGKRHADARRAHDRRHSADRRHHSSIARPEKLRRWIRSTSRSTKRSLVSIFPT